MSHDLPVIVAGFGRCGSSLVMQMLQAGGFPVTGEYPSFECLAYNSGGAPPPDGASKILDLHLNPPPGGPYRWIWLDRNPNEQAQSQAKFLRLVCGLRIAGPEVHRLARSYKGDRETCFEVMRRLGGEVLSVTFEELVTESATTAARIASFVGLRDSERMAAVVRKRPAGCLPYLLECDLIAQPVT